MSQHTRGLPLCVYWLNVSRPCSCSAAFKPTRSHTYRDFDCLPIPLPFPNPFPHAAQLTQLLCIFTVSQAPVLPISISPRKTEGIWRNHLLPLQLISRLLLILFLLCCPKELEACTCLHPGVPSPLTYSQGLQLQRLYCFTWWVFSLPDHFHQRRPRSNSSLTKASRPLFAPYIPCNSYNLFAKELPKTL